jgi:hypothetical protein
MYLLSFVWQVLAVAQGRIDIDGQRPKTDFDRKWISEINQTQTNNHIQPYG